MHFWGLSAVWLTLCASSELLAQRSRVDLADASLDDLLTIKVTSIFRRTEQLLKTAAAVYVITQDDIRRSGATDLPDVLRMVPGLDVAQISSSKWAVSARGFNAQWENKLLVMVDGRSVYAPSFSGVFWDLQDFILEDIENIEVIRGPGATMWGANAVNGVISITTKNAAKTTGGSASFTVGVRRPGDVSLQYGGSIGTKAFYRTFAKQTTRSSLPEATTGELNDAWNLSHTGFRVDWHPSENDDLTIDGDFMRAQAGARVNGVILLDPITYRGHESSGQRAANFRTRWNHKTGEDSDLTVQVYYENINNYETFTTIEHLFDIDLQHSFNAGKRNKIIWGAGQRWALDNNINSPHMGYSPTSIHSGLSSAFLQDEIALSPDRLYLTLGTKLEQNSYTGFEIQPTARILWMPTDKQSIWAAYSRAVRTANRSDRGFRTDLAAWPDGNSVTVLSLMGQEGSRSETLNGYEAGYRYQPSRRLSFDLASFFNVYDHLATVEPGDTFSEGNPFPPHTVFPLYFSNQMKGETYGVEAAASYKLTPEWSLRSGYGFLRMDLHLYPGSQDTEAEAAEGKSPRHQINIGSSVSLPKGFELSANSYFVGSLPASNVRAYTRLDANVVWRVSDNLSLKLSGQNLLNPSRPEFGESEGTAASLMKRSVHAGLTWRF